MESSIINGCKRLGSKCALLFTYSIIGRACIAVSNFFGKLYRGSRFGRFFANGIDNEAAWKSSLLSKLLHLPFLLLGKIASAVTGFCQNTTAGSNFVKLFDNWELMASRVYGFVILFYALTDSLLLVLFRELQPVRLYFNGALAILSILLILINRSPKSIYRGSILLRAAGSFFVEQASNTSRLFLEDADIQAKSNVMAVFIGIALGALGFLLPFQLFVLLVGGLAGTLIIFRKVEVGVFLVVIGMPFLPTMALVGLAIVCLLAFLFHMATDENVKLRHNGLNPYVVCFALVVAVGAFKSFTFLSSVKIMLVYFAFISFYFVIVNTVTDRKLWRALVVSLIAAATLVALYGILQNFIGVKSTQSWVDEQMFTDIKRRVYSTFDNPNVLGEFLVLTIPVSLALFWANKRYGHKMAWLLALLVMAACMVFTWSRGAWLGVLFAVVLFVLVMDKRFLLLCVLGVMFLPVLLSMDNAITARLLSIGNTSDTSTAYRVSIWYASFNMLKDFWLGGIGLGSDAFSMIYPKYAFAGANFALHSHNLFLQICVEMGVVGIVSFVALIVATVKQGLSGFVTRGRGKLMNTCTIALLMGLGGYLLQGLTDNVWYNYKMVLIFWSILGFIASGAQIAKNDELREANYHN